MCAAASAADKVMVITKPVATNPMSPRTNSLPCHQGKRRSNIEMEPSPWGLSPATQRYIGSAPSSVTSTRTTVAMGASSPAASAAMPGW